MWTPPDCARSTGTRRCRRISLSLLALAALLLPAALPALAQSRLRSTSGASGASAASAADLTPERSQLRQTILGLYEVLPMRGGLLLKPHASKIGVKTIELTDGSIAINGETTPPSVVRAWLIADAPPVLQLAELPPAERRQLFGLPVEGSPTAAVPAPKAAASGSADIPKPPARTDSEEASEETDKPETPTAPEPPEAPEPPTPPTPPTSISTGSRVRVGGSARVEANEVVESVVAVGGSVHVEGEVERDVAAVGGPAWIDGKVGGGVTSVGGSVHLGPKAEVEGNVTSVLGHIDADPKARIHGTKTEVSPSEFVLGGRHGKRFGNLSVEPFQGGESFLWTAFRILFKLLLVCLTLLVARPRIERLERRLTAQPWESGGVGLLAVLAFFPALVLATVLTCCLFLILYPVVFLLVLVVGLLGYTTVVYRIGRWSEGRFGWRFGGNPYLAVLVGMAWIESLRIVGALVSVDDGIFNLFGAMVSGFGRLVVFGATILGIGVVLLDRFSNGWRRTPPPDGLPVSPMSPMSPMPPMPPMPPISPISPMPPVSPAPVLEPGSPMPPAPRETWEREP